MKPIFFHDTMQGKKVEFVPRKPGEVSMYVCGLTTSNDSHVGHARTAIVFDLIRRIFKKNGYKVHYISNFTDIDDKIIQRSNEEGVSASQIANKYINRYLDVIDQMHISQPDMYPKVTEHIPAIIEAVQTLIQNGFAYESQGDVYFRVRKSEDYGKLSKRKLDDLKTGARIAPGEFKEDPLDFTLWKKAKPDEPSWDSPWGEGRPGWHIECSVMALKYLGNHFDIHGGGQDLVFPHHENEIAQAEGITCQKPFCKYWIHTGWVTLDKVKMSKSIGNVFRIKDALKHYHPNVLRYFFLATLYSSPLECNEEAIQRAQKNVERISVSLRRISELQVNESSENTQNEQTLLNRVTEYSGEFHDFLRDNFNTPGAFSIIHTLIRDVNKFLDETGDLSQSGKREILTTLDDFFETLGFFQMQDSIQMVNEEDLLEKVKNLCEYFEISCKEEQTLEELIHLFIEKRNQARKEKQFNIADSIRDNLTSIGILLEDTAKGTVYRLEK